MIIRYSTNIFAQIAAIIWYNKFKLLWFISCACVAYFSYHHLGFSKIGVPMIPISILGGALAIFLGFRNSSAYDRWWEGRKIWGQMVNDSRTFVMQLNSYLSKRDETINDEAIDTVLYSIVRRHIAWVYVIKFQLLNQNTEELLKEWIDKGELNFYNNKENIATQLLNKQGLEIKKLQECNIIEDFRQFELINTISSFYDSQGKVERIKSTVFPFYYNYYTRLVLSLFNLLLPFGLVNHLDWTLIPMSVSISFVFTILEKSGSITENPFEGRASDVPMNSIAKKIEIDLLQMIGKGEGLSSLIPKKTTYGAQFLD